MMIRSQDREKLYPLMKGIYVYGTTVNMDLGFSAVDNGGDVLLGEYDSNARCIEILDEIQSKYNTYISSRGGESLMVGGGVFQPFAFTPPKVYEMPEK